MVPKAFPKLCGVLVNLREVSINDAQDITHLMNYDVSRYLWEVPNPYSVEDALNFIKSAHSDFNSLKAIHFAIEYKVSLNQGIMCTRRGYKLKKYRFSQ